MTQGALAIKKKEKSTHLPTLIYLPVFFFFSFFSPLNQNEKQRTEVGMGEAYGNCFRSGEPEERKTTDQSPWLSLAVLVVIIVLTDLLTVWSIRLAHGRCGSISNQSAEASSWSWQGRGTTGWSSHTVSGRRQSSLVCYERYSIWRLGHRMSCFALMVCS